MGQAVLTLPSAQSVMSCSGSSALYMAVVFSHTGKPRKTATTQKERMASRRSHRLSLVSGGGCFCGVVDGGEGREAASSTRGGGDASGRFGGAMSRGGCVPGRSTVGVKVRASVSGTGVTCPSPVPACFLASPRPHRATPLWAWAAPCIAGVHIWGRSATEVTRAAKARHGKSYPSQLTDTPIPLLPHSTSTLSTLPSSPSSPSTFHSIPIHSR